MLAASRVPWQAVPSRAPHTFISQMRVCVRIRTQSGGPRRPRGLRTVCSQDSQQPACAVCSGSHSACRLSIARFKVCDSVTSSTARDGQGAVVGIGVSWSRTHYTGAARTGLLDSMQQGLCFKLIRKDVKQSCRLQIAKDIPAPPTNWCIYTSP